MQFLSSSFSLFRQSQSSPEDPETPPAAGNATAAPPNRFARSPTSPQTPSLGLTTSPQVRKRPAATTLRSSAAKRVHRSADEKRLVGDYSIPADAVQAPRPDSFLHDPPKTAMKQKPGGSNSFKPVNTMGEWPPRPSQHKSPTTYGSVASKSKGPGQKKFYDLEPEWNGSRQPKVRDKDTRPSIPLKKRKMDPTSSHSKEVISVEDDEDELADVRPALRLDARSADHISLPAASVSRQSFVSRGTDSERPSKSNGPSAFSRVNTLTNPRRKRTRKTPLTALRRRTPEHGAARPDPIARDDDEFVNKPTAFESELFDQLQESAGLGQDELHEGFTGRITSKHFDTPNKTRINPTTSPHRKERTDGRWKTSATANLRDNFRRTDDVVPRPTGRSKSPGRHMRALEKSVNEKLHPIDTAWPLCFVRTGQMEIRARGLYLRQLDATDSFQVLSQNQVQLSETIHEFNLDKITIAHSDGDHCIRLSGSRLPDSNVYQLDLEFDKARDFERFNALVSKPTLHIKVITREHTLMQKLFSNPPPSNNKVGSTPLIEDPGLSAPTQHTYSQAESASRRSGPRPLKTTDLMRADAIQSPARLNRTKKEEPETVAHVQDRMGSTRLARSTRANRSVYDVDAEHEDPAPEKFSVVHGLGTPWDKPLQYGSGRRRALVDFSDLVRLDEDTMLNDSLIDFYLIYLFNQAKLPADKVYFFNTHFFTALTRHASGQKTTINYAAVARWTAKDDIFKHDYVVVPINDGNLHWYLAIICNVSNIPRRPVADLDQDKNAASETRKPMISECGQRKEGNLTEPQDPGVTGNIKKETSSRENGSEEVEDGLNTVDEEPSRINLVDADISESKTAEIAGAEDGTFPSSPAAEARMEKLSIQDRIPKGILGASRSSPAKKKARRKSGPSRRIDPHEPVILILDSLASGTHRGKAVRVLKDYIHEEGKAKRGMDAHITQNGFYAKEAEIPIQTNFSDCGVYVLGYAQKFFANPDEFIRHMLSGEMDSETDWPDMAPHQMRNEMRDILFGLEKHQKQERKMTKAQKKGNNIASKQAQTVSPIQAHEIMKLDEEAKPADRQNSVEVTKTLQPQQPADEPKPAESPRPSLGSPFRPQDSVNQHPEQPLTGADEIVARSIRKTSPRVVIKINSPKRPFEETGHQKESPEKETGRGPKRSKTQGGERDMSPSYLKPHVTLSSPRSRHELVAPSVSATVGPSDLRLQRGSSADPILVDDSQENIKPPKMYSPRMVKRHGRSTSREVQHFNQGPAVAMFEPEEKRPYLGNDSLREHWTSDEEARKCDPPPSECEEGHGFLPIENIADPDETPTIDGDNTVIAESLEHLRPSLSPGTGKWQAGDSLPH